MNAWSKLAVGSLGTLAVAAVHVSPVTALLPAGRVIFPMLTRVDGARDVALTFDDGPDKPTEKLLKLLDGSGARATFFVLGEQVERSPGLIREMIQAGHEIGVHGYRHRYHLRLTPWQAEVDLKRAKVVIEDVAGKETTLYRAPHGIFSLSSYREAGRLGWLRVLFSRLGKDWREGVTSDQIIATIGHPLSGDIIVLHDSERYSSPGCTAAMLAALPRVLERIQQQGMAARSIGELLVPDRG